MDLEIKKAEMHIITSFTKHNLSSLIDAEIAGYSNVPPRKRSKYKRDEKRRKKELEMRKKHDRMSPDCKYLPPVPVVNFPEKQIIKLVEKILYVMLCLQKFGIH